MNEPLISVIIPVYNIAPYISRCLDSVLEQTYENIEIIAVDDGSVDGADEIMDEYDARFEKIHAYHIENGGVTKARLFGLTKASGDYVGFCDGDDYIDSDMYKRLVENAEKYNADISHCGYQMVFPNRIDYYYNTGFVGVWNKTDGLKELLSGDRVEPGLCNKLYKRSLFEDVISKNRMDTSIKNMEDLLMNYWLFKQADISVYEDFCPYHYMIRRGSAATSTITEQKLKDPIKVFNTIKNDCEDAELKRIINSRIASVLIGQATMYVKNQPGFVIANRVNTRKELRQLLPEIIKENYSKRTKIMTAWASFSPYTYRQVHQIYSRIRGTDRKYEVD